MPLSAEDTRSGIGAFILRVFSLRWCGISSNQATRLLVEHNLRAQPSDWRRVEQAIHAIFCPRFRQVKAEIRCITFLKRRSFVLMGWGLEDSF